MEAEITAVGATTTGLACLVQVSAILEVMEEKDSAKVLEGSADLVAADLVMMTTKAMRWRSRVGTQTAWCTDRLVGAEKLGRVEGHLVVLTLGCPLCPSS